MEINVLFHEGADEVVTVIVAFLETEFKVNSSSSGSVFKLRRVQEFLKVVGGSSVN